MAEDTKETIKVGAEDSKENLDRILVNTYDRLLFLSKVFFSFGESGEDIQEPDCKVLESYLMDVGREIEKGSKILEDFNFVEKQKPEGLDKQQVEEEARSEKIKDAVVFLIGADNLTSKQKESVETLLHFTIRD